ncbi:MAG: LysM peptidoglycan-binding domain-containing protein [Verrucomicrobiaceae bacterium]
MKPLTLTSALIAALVLAAPGETSTQLRSRIAQKEIELSKIQNELADLKNQLASPSSAAVQYTVQSGDTLSSIARRHGITFSKLVAWNKITDPSKIIIGQKLIVSDSPVATPASKPSPSASGDTYTVKRGDTFYSIAQANKISVGKLKELNPDTSPSRILEGQKLAVAGSPRPSTKKAPVSTPVAATRSKKQSSTAALTRRTASTKPVSTPSSSRKAVAAAPPVKKEASPAPAPPKVEEPMPEAPSAVSSIILTDETTFAEFAQKHGTSTDKLNSLNGWSLPKATVLARGSEIYVPR